MKEVRHEVSQAWSRSSKADSWAAWQKDVAASSASQSWQEVAADWLSNVMLCIKPYGQFGCGQCMPCRLNRRRLWTARLMLESFDHGDVCFVTLTYLDDPWSLVPRDLQLFLKRLRKEIERPIRFFACGEYGEKWGRPHFHVVLFGVSRVLHSHLIYKCWGHGFVDVGDLNPRSAAYCCGYVCKAMTKWGDGRLQGRHPEFVRMSLRPGIGSCVIGSISKQLMGGGASLAVASAGDVPSEVRIAGKLYPLGRYLRSLLRLAIGWDDPRVPGTVVRQFALRKSLESLEDLKKLEQKRKHSALKAEFRNSVSRTAGSKI